MTSGAGSSQSQEVSYFKEAGIWVRAQGTFTWQESSLDTEYKALN